jgi:hypothetical protein
MSAKFATLEALEAELEAMGQVPAEYWDKQIHRIPEAPSVERVPWLLTRLAGKVVLHAGCAGPLHVELHKVCKRVYGLDQAPARYPDDVVIDIEAEELPRYGDVEVVLLAEIVEHLVSPGVLLWQIREQYPQCEVIVTVPNAYSASAQAWVQRGFENVNADHVAWYSYQTLGTLLKKCGFTIHEWCWYGGKPRAAEGLIAVAHKE